MIDVAVGGETSGDMICLFCRGINEKLKGSRPAVNVVNTPGSGRNTRSGVRRVAFKSLGVVGKPGLFKSPGTVEMLEMENRELTKQLIHLPNVLKKELKDERISREAIAAAVMGRR